MAMSVILLINIHVYDAAFQSYIHVGKNPFERGKRCLSHSVLSMVKFPQSMLVLLFI